MAKKKNVNTDEPVVVTISNSRMTDTGVASRRASLLREVLLKLGEVELADEANSLLIKCRRLNDAEYQNGRNELI